MRAMRAMLSGRLLVLTATLLLCLGSAASGSAGDSIFQVGHSKHGHHGHHGHRYGRHYGHHNFGHSSFRHYGSRYYGSRSRIRLHIGLGSLYSGYRNYVPYRSSYYVDPYCYGGTYYRSYYSPSPYGIYYGANSSPRYNLSPTSQPAELAYGPQAVKQFMGVDRDFALGDLQRSNVQRNQVQRDDPKLVLGNVVANPIDPKVRQTNWDAHRRAISFMNQGDEAFAQGRFGAALADYDKAVLSAPDVAIAYVRQTFASLASGQYSVAADSLHRAVTIDPEVVNDIRFELEDMYQGNEKLKEQHLESLAKAALAAPNEGSFLVLLGAAMHYDRQILRAEKFFQQAVKLGGKTALTAEAFLPELKGAI